jgi:hypothetical protein
VRTAGILFFVLLIALAIRPWRTDRALHVWVVGHIAFLHALVWLTQGVGYNADARGYLDTFGRFIAGLTSYYPPGYPVLLGPLHALFPNATGLAVAGTQHILMVLSLYALSRVARACLGSDLATLGLLIAGSVGPTLLLPQVAFSENPAFFGMAGAVWFVCDPEPDILRFDIAAGLLLGWAALSRVTPIVALALPVFLLHLHMAPSRAAAVTRTARVLLAAILVLGLSATWTWHKSRDFRIANSSGLHLYSRVVTEQLLLNREGPDTRRFLAIVGDRALKNVGHWEISPVLMAHGLRYRETVALMGGVATEGGRSYPLRLLLYSVAMMWREYAVDPLPDVPQWGTGSPAPELDNAPLLGIRTSSLLWRNDLDRTFATSWPVLKWMPLSGLLFLPWLRGRLVFLALLLVPAAYLFAGSFADMFVGRYTICVVPFALILIPAPLAGIAGRWRSRHDPAAASLN